MRSIKIYLKVLLNYIKALPSYFLTRKSSEGDKGLIIFNFRQIDRDRNYAQFAYFFDRYGYQIIMVHHPLLIGNMPIYSRYILSLPNLLLRFSLPENKRAIYFFDTISDRTDKYHKSIYVSDDIYGDSFRIDNLSPYPMIPRLYFEGMTDEIYQLRETKKNHRIYFSGNQKRGIYDSTEFCSFFKKLNRIMIVEALKANLSNSQLEIVEDIGQYTDQEFENKMILQIWERQSLKSNKIKGRISNEEWLNNLAKTDFFLACPGYVQPVCHNQIEAMSLGVILILEHPEYFNPPLEHMKNCVVFSGQDDMIDKVKMVFNLDVNTISKMSHEVISYYEQFLSASSFCKYIEDLPHGKNQLFIITDAYFHKKLMPF